jgi:hypothetical protein
MWWRRTITDRFAAIRRRMIFETEIGLLVGLRFPERARRIPTLRVGTGSFDPRYARAFWEETLGDLSEVEQLAKRHDDIYDPDHVPLYDPAAAQRA